jgi:hypothetical protein
MWCLPSLQMDKDKTIIKDINKSSPQSNDWMITFKTTPLYMGKRKHKHALFESSNLK